MDPVRPPTAAAILAGGRARRFGGRDKSRLVVEGRTIIVRQIEVLQQVGAAPIFVVGPDDGRYGDVGLTAYPDRVAGAGALGGIATALDVAPTPLVLVVGCDQPFLHAGLLGALIGAAAGHDGAWVCTPRGPEPLLACYRTEARARVGALAAAGTHRAADLGRVLDLAEIGPAAVARFGPVERLLANLNTPDDYARVQ